MGRSVFEAELLDQPAALRRLLDRGRFQAERIAARIKTFGPRLLILAARGSSDNAARYAQYVFGARHRLVAALAAPSLFTRMDANPRLDNALVIAISQSGQSPDVIAVVEAARRQGALTVVLTNDPTSSLAQAGDEIFPLHAGEERAIAATKSYTNELFAIALLSVALLERDEWHNLAVVPGVVDQTMRLNGSLSAAAGRFRMENRFVVVGRGFNYATAFEVSLKLEEMAGVMAKAYSTADFLHGPVALMDRHVPLFLIAPPAPWLRRRTRCSTWRASGRRLRS